MDRGRGEVSRISNRGFSSRGWRWPHRRGWGRGRGRGRQEVGGDFSPRPVHSEPQHKARDSTLVSVLGRGTYIAALDRNQAMQQERDRPHHQGSGRIKTWTRGRGWSRGSRDLSHRSLEIMDCTYKNETVLGKEPPVSSIENPPVCLQHGELPNLVSESCVSSGFNPTNVNKEMLSPLSTKDIPPESCSELGEGLNAPKEISSQLAAASATGHIEGGEKVATSQIKATAPTAQKSSDQDQQASKQTGNGKKKRKKNKKNNNFTACDDYPAVPYCDINKNIPFEEQVAELIKEVAGNQEKRRRQVTEIIHLLHKRFSSIIKGIRFELFGSSRTGLAYSTSDLDIMAFIGNDILIPDFVVKYGRIMYMTRQFDKVTVLGHTRIPLVKARHIASDLRIDVSCTSMLGIANSTWLEAMVKQKDPRVYQLLLLLSIWCRTLHLTGPTCLSSFTMNLLGVYYLQTRSPPILPPVLSLVQPHPTRLISLRPNVHEILSEGQKNTQTFSEVFLGFWKYYSTFDFDSNVINVLTAEVFPLDSFPDCLPPIYKELEGLIGTCDNPQLGKSGLYVMEPLVLSNNTCATRRAVMGDRLKLTIKAIASLLSWLPPEEHLAAILKDIPKPLIEGSIVEIPHSASPSLVRLFLSRQVKCEDMLERGPKIPRLDETWLRLESNLNLPPRREGLLGRLASTSLKSLLARELVVLKSLDMAWAPPPFKALGRLSSSCLTLFDTHCGPSNMFTAYAQAISDNLKAMLESAANSEEDPTSLIAVVDSATGKMRTRNARLLAELVADHCK